MKHAYSNQCRRSGYGPSYLLVIPVLFLIFGCASSRQGQGASPTEEADELVRVANDDHNNIQSVPVVGPAPVNPIMDTSEVLEVATVEPEALPEPKTVKPLSAVAAKIVENYENSQNKKPGGHCLAASKSRFQKAYEAIHGHSMYRDLPSDIASNYYSPSQVFDHLYASTFGRHQGWRTLPRKYRGRGGAGAIAYAGMGDLVDWFGIWSGELRPGAVMQVWKRNDDYKKVIRGIRGKDFDPFGHSFIFLRYERDDNGKIIGIRIADQGYQSYRPLVPEDYEVWWAANLTI
ncbi:hypothetical protein FK220_018765 [Flavobacteriaceae bacterium TP-CH-4]|uniref:Uncharacterized protein n=1 Tax=Pelagihabitans pacificus TaxID=2696054 RepID=A0A967AWD4_9FLAO|nr:hypothetical protein [Pelagihabitans pacificus]NHF61403.1 hypothetical protein [Pelagihabitans pacificus]